jgi:hypothetical protein
MALQTLVFYGNQPSNSGLVWSTYEQMKDMMELMYVFRYF